ncbi:MAG: hypothetical protein IH623_00530 [Verrucomicrobia bacterium]|nr:hypothetical protein [Verrucomicrobiota bacterium]
MAFGLEVEVECYLLYYAVKRHYLVQRLFLSPQRVTTALDATDLFLALQTVENMPEHVAADSWAESFNLRDAELGGKGVDRLAGEQFLFAIGLGDVIEQPRVLMGSAWLRRRWFRNEFMRPKVRAPYFKLKQFH